MKRIEAIIKPFKLDEVREALKDAGVQGMTVLDVKGFGNRRGNLEIYRGSEYAFVREDFPMIMIIVYAPDEQVTTIVETIANAAKTGKVGDGKIAVIDLVEVLRIRTGERGDHAV